MVLVWIPASAGMTLGLEFNIYIVGVTKITLTPLSSGIGEAILFFSLIKLYRTNINRAIPMAIKTIPNLFIDSFFL